MSQQIGKLLDWASDYFAHRKGLLPLVGIGLIFLNLILAMIFPADWFIIRTNLLLHLGLIVGILGLLLANAL